MDLVRLLEETPEDVSVLGPLMDIEEEDKDKFSEDFDIFYDSQKRMLYLGDGERVIGVRKRNTGGNEILVSKDIAPVDDYEKIIENEDFASVVGYAEAEDFAGYDGGDNGFYKSPEHSISETTVENRSNSGDQSVSRTLNK